MVSPAATPVFIEHSPEILGVESTGLLVWNINTVTMHFNTDKLVLNPELAALVSTFDFNVRESMDVISS